MTNKVDINGFGRIGRRTLSHIAASARNDLEVIEVNTTGPLETSAHLLNYDSIHGRFPSDILIENKTMDLGRGPTELFSSYDMNKLDWKGCDIVLEGTEKFIDGLKSKT